MLGGASFVYRARRMHVTVKAGGEVAPMRQFHLSNTYLCVLFVAIAVDAAIGPAVLGWPF